MELTGKSMGPSASLRIIMWVYPANFRDATAEVDVCVSRTMAFACYS
jgi:hypothetical protein